MSHIESMLFLLKDLTRKEKNLAVGFESRRNLSKDEMIDEKMRVITLYMLGCKICDEDVEYADTAYKVVELRKDLIEKHGFDEWNIGRLIKE